MDNNKKQKLVESAKYMTELEFANIRTEINEAKVAISQVGAAVSVAAERIHELQQEIQERRLAQRSQDGEIVDLMRKMRDLERQFSFLMHRVERLLNQREYGEPLVSYQEPVEGPDNQ